MVLAKVLKFHIKIVDMGAFSSLGKLSMKSIKNHCAAILCQENECIHDERFDIASVFLEFTV